MALDAQLHYLYTSQLEKRSFGLPSFLEGVECMLVNEQVGVIFQEDSELPFHSELSIVCIVYRGQYIAEETICVTANQTVSCAMSDK